MLQYGIYREYILNIAYTGKNLWQLQFLILPLYSCLLPWDFAIIFAKDA